VGLFDVFRKVPPPADPAVLQRIADLAAENDLRMVAELLSFLPPPTSPYGAAAALAVEGLVDAASPEEVAAFDQWYRERTYTGVGSVPRPSWDSMQLGRLDSWTRQYPATVAIATCHRNGFVRQKAVELLAESHDGAELPFLLVRLNDWVAPVRAAAQSEVRARVTVVYAARWVSCLELLDRVRLGRRGDHAWLGAAVEGLLRRDDARVALEAGLVGGTRGVRRACVRIAAGLTDSTRLLSLALRDADPITSGEAANVLCRSLDADALREALDVMQHGNTRARCLALDTWCDRIPQDAEPHLRAALLDSATSVRELARFRGQRLGLVAVEFRTYYREQLEAQTGELFITALRGLAETGTVDDVPLFLQYIAHPRGRVREAAILGLGRCDGQKHAEVLMGALGDSNLRVVKAARRYARLYLGRGAVPKRAWTKKPRGCG